MRFGRRVKTFGGRGGLVMYAMPVRKFPSDRLDRPLRFSIHRFTKRRRIISCALVASLAPVMPLAAQVCDIESAANCQSFDYTALAAARSNLHVGSGQLAADDFRPMGDTISSLCVWGYYLVEDSHQLFGYLDCGNSVPVDQFFRVRVYEDDNHRPCPLIAERTVGSVREYVPGSHETIFYPPQILQVSAYVCFGWTSGGRSHHGIELGRMLLA